MPKIRIESRDGSMSMEWEFVHADLDLIIRGLEELRVFPNRLDITFVANPPAKPKPKGSCTEPRPWWRRFFS